MPMFSAGCRVSTLVLVWLVLLLLCSTHVHAADDAVNVPVDQFAEGTTAVYPVLQIIDVTKVDGVEQSFYVDFYMSLFWQDTGITSANASDLSELSPERKAQIARMVDFEFINKKEYEVAFQTVWAWATPPKAIAKYVTYEQLPGYPWVELMGRYNGQFKAKLFLQNFPYDRQLLELQLESVTFDNVSVIFVAPEFFKGNENFKGDLEMIEWTPLESNVKVTNTYYDTWGTSYSRMTWMLELERRAEYYIDKIITGIALLTVMAHLAFAIEVSDPNRAVISLTAFLGLVTYLFVLSSDVPKVAYTTRMDSFVNLSFYTVFIDFVVALILYAIQDYAHHAREAAEAAAQESTITAARVQVVGNKNPIQHFLDSSNSARGPFCDEEELGTNTTDAAEQSKVVDECSPRLADHRILTMPPGDATARSQRRAAWWTTWFAWRRRLDLIFTAVMLLVYMIASAVVLKG